MALTEEKYQRLKGLVANGGEGLSAAVREQALAAIEDYENKSLGDVQVLPSAPARPAADAGVPDLVKQLDPQFPLQPQVLATQPATAHPKGDKAAADEWIRGDIDNPSGLVVVYDAPAAEVRKRLTESPELLAAIGYGDRPIPPNIAAIESGDSIHQAYNDYMWRQTADSAVKAGKTPYRYSKAPWLREGKGASLLSTLSTKLKGAVLPGIEAAQGFVMGLDDAGGFGATSAAQTAGAFGSNAPPLAPGEEAEFDYHPTLGKVPKELGARKGSVPGAVPVGGGKDEVVGGVAAAANDATDAEGLDMVSEEHPLARTAGQVYGAMPGLAGAAVKGAAKVAGEGASRLAAPVAKGLDTLADWMPSNMLWNAIVKKGTTMKAPLLLTAPASAAIAGTAHQGISEAVRAGGNLIGTGETGTTPEALDDRMREATLNSLAFGAPGAILQGASRGHANWVRSGKRYDKLPERLEGLGTEFKFGKGPVPPKVVPEAIAEAAARPGGGVEPIDIFAERLEKPLARAAKTHDQAVRTRVHDAQAEVFKSPEGKAPLPAKNLVDTAVSLMRKRTASIRSRPPTAVGVPNAQNRVRGVLNSNIDGISLTPVEGAVPISLKEMEAWLSPRWHERVLKAARSGSSVASRGRGLTVRAAERAAAVGEEAASDLARGEPLRMGRPQLEGERGGLARAQRPVARRQPGALPEGRGELSTDVDSFPHMPDPRDARAPAGAPPARDVGDVAPKARKGARWRRRYPEEVTGEPVPSRAAAARAAAKGRPAPKVGGKAKPARESRGAEDVVAALRERGVKKVYVLPRRYNAQHHESAIQMLRQRGDESAKDRDLKALYHAALQDRDARPWKGNPGGWSAMQRQHETEIGSAKDIRRRVAPNVPEGTYRRVTSIAKQGKGQSKTLSAMEMMAARAGVTDQLRGARTLDPLEKLQQRISYGETRRGDKLSPLSPTGAFDAANVRFAYPITRQLGGQKGKTAGPVGGGQTGRLALLGEDDDIEARRRARDAKAERSATSERQVGGPKKRRKRTVKKKRRSKP